MNTYLDISIDSSLWLISLAGSLLLTVFTFLLIMFITNIIQGKKKGIVYLFLRIEKWPISTIFGLFFLYLTFPFSEYTDEDLYRRAVIIGLIIGFTWFSSKFISVIREIVVKKFSIEKEDNLQERKVRTQFQYIRAILSIIIVIVGIGLIMWQFDQLRALSTGIFASAGLITLVIAFAANQTLSNLIAGFQIAFTQPFRIDDVVIVEGEWGRIEEITLTYIVVRIWDQRRLVLPITYFVNNPFQNWTRTSADIIGTVYLYLDYTVPVEKVREELMIIVGQSELWDKRVAVLQVTDTSEKTITLRALVSAGNASEAWDLRCFVREKLVTYLQNNFPESLPKIRLEEGSLSVRNERNPAKTLDAGMTH